MKDMQGHQTLMRIYIGEEQKYKHQPLYQAIVKMLRKEKLAGATVLRGITGFGENSGIRKANLLALSQDLPMIIECVDTRENIERVMPMIDEMIGNGLVTFEKVEAIVYQS
jgi:PII-like signaling protein